jgi:hypothetical protein
VTVKEWFRKRGRRGKIGKIGGLGKSLPQVGWQQSVRAPFGGSATEEVVDAGSGHQ